MNRYTPFVKHYRFFVFNLCVLLEHKGTSIRISSQSQFLGIYFRGINSMCVKISHGVGMLNISYIKA